MASATLLAGPAPATAGLDEVPSLVLASDSPELASIPLPPEPPRLPAGLTFDPLDDHHGVEAEVMPEGEEAEAPAGPASDEPLVFDDPIFEDPRAEVPVNLPPGIPVPTYPIEINRSVEAVIAHFQQRERERFGLWIARSGRYVGMIQRIFRERGLPEELAYTAMIESGFSPRAVSRVGAKGLWQFMEATAKRYGLTVNRWVDERFDPVKSTVAAAKYLDDLYGRFGHWFLAQAAYNAGEARVGRAITRAKTSDFWALTRTRHLPNETKNFVPQILAATLITQAPSRYGFDVTMEPPLVYDEVHVKRTLHLETVAELAQVPLDEVRELNTALRGGITPPFGGYTVRLPKGSGERFETALRETPPSKLVQWGLHRVARHQTLREIARLYRTTPERLAEINQLRKGRLRGVPDLLVPVSNKVAPKPGRGRIAARDGDRLIIRH
ncbi:MAG: transglycosylase SLT domain-containing protein [Candidatus Rokuibacteriota bacterium]